MKKTAIILIGIAALILSGCAGSPARTSFESSRNRSNMLKLNIGMTKPEVLKIMGEPYKTEVYKTGESKATEFWIYWSEPTVIYDYSVSDRNFTPLAFESGILQGWGRNYYDDTIRISKEIRYR